MKLISWNVNGLRACMQKGFLDAFNRLDADFFCLQETKMQPGQLTLDLPGYHQYWYSAEKKGYSGTAIFTKHEPLSVRYGVGVEELDKEGRLICLEYPGFYALTCYTPNAQDGLKRLDHRLAWDAAFRDYLSTLSREKPLWVFSTLLDAGFTDTFRYLYPDKTEAYSWWSYRFHAREKNVGWRIDYFLVSQALKDRIRSATIYDDIFGSDHCPVGLEIDL